MTPSLRVVAVLAFIVIGSAAAVFTVGPAGLGGTIAIPAPSPVLIARGEFVEHDFGPVEFEASRVGSSVMGHMTVGPNWSGSNRFAVDLQCAWETIGGIVIIGGSTIVAGEFMEVGAPAWIVIERGSPDQGTVEIAPGEPAFATPDCLTNLNRRWQNHLRMWAPYDVLSGGIEFGP